MARVLVIGYGNPLRGDDGLGWHAAECLATSLAGPDVEIITCHQLTPELAEPVSRAERVIFIDAETRGPAGQLTVRRLTSVLAKHTRLSHTLDPATLLGSAREIYSTSPQGFVLSVAGESFAYGEELSPKVQSAIPELLRVAYDIIAGSCKKLGRRRP
jgi:hydrogenase maturation protease